MGKKHIQPFTTFEAAHAFFRCSPCYQQAIGRVTVIANTWLQVERSGEPNVLTETNGATSYALVFYGQKIVRYYLDGRIQLMYNPDQGGPFSITTARRMTAFSPFTVQRVSADEVWAEVRCDSESDGKYSYRLDVAPRVGAWHLPLKPHAYAPRSSTVIDWRRYSP